MECWSFFSSTKKSCRAKSFDEKTHVCCCCCPAFSRFIWHCVCHSWYVFHNSNYCFLVFH